jgi:hypothetical protein
MATLVLQSAGAALGSVFGPIGAVVGRTLGGFAGAAVQARLSNRGASNKVVEGPRLHEMEGLGSTEGASIPRVYGKARLGGQVIWATKFEETITTTTQRNARRGGKSISRPKSTTTTTTYTYEANLAVAIAEGKLSSLRRIWADGKELDLTTLTYRFHKGDESQMPDPLIVAKEGAVNAPAYRGIAYVVFERLPLQDFGNRIPQFSFEVVRSCGGLPDMIRSVCLIPGATEFGYDSQIVTRVTGFGSTTPDNRNQLWRGADLHAALDNLQDLCPNLEEVSIIVSWFGDDLRAGSCTIAPRVESYNRETYGGTWHVADLERAAARQVSLVGSVPAYGGTPSDASVIRLIQTLKSRGLKVTLYPFVMMDIPAGNTLSDPWTGGSSQPAYPWRGRITCDPAPSRAGTVDATAATATQIANFFGVAQQNQFTLDGHDVVYNGPEDWGFRRHILHYAKLSQAAGGVDAFIIGSELVSLTRVRSSGSVYPAATQLANLAADVRSLLGSGTKLTYAADWTEYGAHVLNGGLDIRYPLDTLWSHPAVDAVGIDFYPPLSDWRDDPEHLDETEAPSIYDRDYLKSRLGAGEAYDWFYASQTNRLAQTRTPITDGAYNKPWIYRAKDIKNWWSQPHIQRVAGVETTATGWVPQSKPIWLTEIGVPAVDKGTNGPNVFPDPKSSENAMPPFSSGNRDDLIQTRGLEAILTRFDPSQPGFDGADNPVSSLYGGRMVDISHASIWAFDARPYPAFPDLSPVWADGANWQKGHWITGRIDSAPLDRLMQRILADYGEPGQIVVDGFAEGYVIDRPMSLRSALEPLVGVFGCDAGFDENGFRCFSRTIGKAHDLSYEELVDEADKPLISAERVSNSEIPRQIDMGFIDPENEYRRATTSSRRLAESGSKRERHIDTALVLRRSEAQKLTDEVLQEMASARESLTFKLSPKRLEIETGDLIRLITPSGARLLRVMNIEDRGTRLITTRSAEPQVRVFSTPDLPKMQKTAPPVAGRPAIAVLDLAVAEGNPEALQFIAGYARPWPSSLGIWRSSDGTSYTLHAVLNAPALMGTTLNTFPAGPIWRWDRASGLDVELASGSLSAVTEEAALGGGNLAALRGPDNRWQILSFAGAELIGPKRYRLSTFLRGLGGDEEAASFAVPTGALFVMLDEAVLPLTDQLSDQGQPWLYRIGPINRDLGDDAMVNITATASNLALKPLSPVHIKAQREAGGMRISWIRRTRNDGDAFEPSDIPLGEETEAYEVEIMNGANVVRLMTTGTPSVLYTSAEELADFGVVQSTLSLRVYQISTLIGRGFVGQKVVDL